MLEAHKFYREALKANLAGRLIDRNRMSICDVRTRRSIREVCTRKSICEVCTRKSICDVCTRKSICDVCKKEVKRAGLIQWRALATKCESTPGSSQLQ